MASASLTAGHPATRNAVNPASFTDLESYLDYYVSQAGPIGPSGTYTSGKFKGQTQDQVFQSIKQMGMQRGLKSRSQAPAPAAPATAARTATPTAPAPAGATPPPAPGAAPAPAAQPIMGPPRPSMINGQTSTAFFQDAANRQGRSNSYGRVQPQTPAAAAPGAAPAPAPAATPAPAAAPVDPALIARNDALRAARDGGLNNVGMRHSYGPNGGRTTSFVNAAGTPVSASQEAQIRALQSGGNLDPTLNVQFNHPIAPAATPAAPQPAPIDPVTAKAASVAKTNAALDAKYPVLFGKPGQVAATRELATNTAQAAAGGMNPAGAAVTNALAAPPRPTIATAPVAAGGMGAIATALGRVGKRAIDAAGNALAALPKPSVEYQDMTPADSKAVSGAASYNQQVVGALNPFQHAQGATSAVTAALPGMTPPTYSSPMARLKGDFNTVHQMAKDGLIQRKPKTDPNAPTILQKPRIVVR